MGLGSLNLLEVSAILLFLFKDFENSFSHCRWRYTYQGRAAGVRLQSLLLLLVW